MSHGHTVNGVYTKREYEKDKLRMGGGSWSINLSELIPFETTTIVFITEKAKYTIDYNDAQAYGFERTLGGEEKLVVPIKHWEVTHAKAKM